MSKHTPGPWHFTGSMRNDNTQLRYKIGAQRGVEVACVWVKRPGDHRHHFDARLIAAAPELLEAAEAFIDPANVIGDTEASDEEIEQGTAEGITVEISHVQWRYLVAAIRRALGEE